MLPAGGAQTLTAWQLEAGDSNVAGRLGAGAGKWRLTVEADRPLQVVNVAVSAAGSWDNLSTVPAGPAPADALAFAGRFAGGGVVFESRSFTATAEFFADGRFAETLEYFTSVWRAGGHYDYVSAGPHAGRVTTERDDGDACAVDMYFASRGGGRFATRCAGGGADDLWFGGRWHVEGEEDDGGPAQAAYGVNDALPGVPTSGVFGPAELIGGSARASGGSTTINLDDGGYFDLNDGTRYTCASTGGCEIVDGTVTRGNVTGRVSGSGGGEADDEGSLALNFEWLLDNQNSSPEGITYADGRFYVLDRSDDKVYAYSVAGARDASADFELHDDGGAGIAYGDGRFYVLDWSIDMVRVYPGPSEPVRQVTGASPNFPAGSGPGNQDYTVGTAIDDLLLPAATGGDGPLTYSLSPRRCVTTAPPT